MDLRALPQLVCTPCGVAFQVLIQSFSPDCLRKIQALKPSLPLILLYKEEEEYSETIREDLANTQTYAVA